MKKLLAVIIVLIPCVACAFFFSPGGSTGGSGSTTTDASLLTSGILPAARIGDNSVTNAKFNFSGGTTANEGNAFYGWGAGGTSISGASQNTGVGSASLYNLTSGAGNVAVGRGALYSNTSGTLNVAIGLDAGRGNTIGAQNVAIGQDALFNNSISSSNIAIGNRALIATVGANNVAIGDDAGANMSGGSGNVFLGHNAGANESGSNTLYIENSNTSTPLIKGNFAARTLTVNGQLQADNVAITGGSISGATGVPLLVSVPDNVASTCTAGHMSYDNAAVYLCVSANTWRKATIAAW